MLFGGLLLLLILAGIWLWTPDKDRAGLEVRDTNGPADFVEAVDYLKAIANVTLVPFPGVGHPPQEEATAASLASVRAFLK